MSGRVGDLSPKQADALEQFKKNLEDVIQPHHDDHYLLRWLRARKFDLKKSEKMLRDTLTWRELVGADTIHEDWEVPEVLKKYYAGGLHGHDKEGSPIWVEVAGHCDIKGILHSVKKSDIVRMKIHACETIHQLFKENSEKLGKPVDGLVILLDLEHYGLKHLWKPGIDVLNEVLAMYEAHYPETTKCNYVINAPRFFPVAYNLVKHFLSEDTQKKIIVLGGNWKEKLLQYIDADQLPVHWGGTAADPDGDPYCRSKICMGGPVPKELYIHKENFVDMSHFTSVHVGRASSLEVKVEVETPGSVIRWQFLTEHNDIAFGVYHQVQENSKKQLQAVVPRQRVNSHMVPEDGVTTVNEPGIYVLKFDNTYSWVRSKKLMHLVEVVPPGGDTAPQQSSEESGLTQESPQE